MQDVRAEYEQDIQECMSVIHKNGIILYPTDTIWGLGCNAHDEVAIEKIMQLKQRDKVKTFVLLMSDVRQLSKFIASPLPDLESKLKEFIVPTTVVYDSAINLPQALIAANGSIAVRITSDPFCRSLIKRMKAPLVSTSANLSGEESPTLFGLIKDYIVNGVDYVVKWRQHDMELKSPSTILKLEKDGRFTKLR